MSYEIGTGALPQQIGSLPSTGTSGPVQSKGTAQGSEVSELATGDAGHTNLSPLGGLVSQALATSDTRTAKIASLQQAITSGEYSVSSSDVADKLVQSLLE